MTDDEQRKRLAYADRAETLEVARCANHGLADCPRCGCYATIGAIADGTGRHSRKEMEQDVRRVASAGVCTWREDNACKVCGETPDVRDGERDHSRGCYSVNDSGGGVDVVELCQCVQCKWDRVDADDRSAHINMNLPPRLPHVIAGVSFTSVPQLCAAYEYALEMLKRLYLMTDRKQHAWQPEQDAMLEARALLLAAGKDVE